MTIERTETGLKIWKNIVFGAEATGGILLAPTKGEIMQYGKHASKRVDFPWEYDIDGISIQCIDAGDVLHYIIAMDDERLALLQSTAALEKESIDGIDKRIVFDEETKGEIENLELEWEIVVISD